MTPQDPKPVIPEGYLDLLESPSFAHVATIGPRGEPRSTPMWIGWDGEHIKSYRYLEVREVVDRVEQDPDMG